ncbi:MAG: nitrogenase component 1 [Methanomicrobiaceae archaeon]|nr:nitrogenase component 1 [Methanomicrobiaceae archaeon]
MNSKHLHKNISRLEGCTVTGALTVTAFVKDAATIVHGPHGCCHQASSVFHSAMLYNECFDIPDIFSSGLDENGIIFGGEDCLEDAIKQAVSEDFGCVFVIGTCISDTIGDDIGSICAKYTDIPVIPIHASGFLGGSFEKGFFSALKGVAKLIEIPGENLNVISGDSCNDSLFDDIPLVNIIGEKNLEYEVEENFLEVKRLINLLGADINIRFVRNITVDQIKKFRNAKLNIIREDPSGETAAYFEKLTGIPSLSQFPYGISGTLEFLKDAGKCLGISPDSAIKKEKDYQKEMFSSFEDIRGEKISFDSFGFQKAESELFSEIKDYTGILTDPDGAVIPIPFYTPVGTTGVKKMLSQWRRFINA